MSSLHVAATKQDSMAQAIMSAISNQLETKSHEIVMRHKKQMIEEMEAMRREVVAAAAIKIAKYTQFEMALDRMVLTVEFKDNGTNQVK